MPSSSSSSIPPLTKIVDVRQATSSRMLRHCSCSRDEIAAVQPHAVDRDPALPLAAEPARPLLRARLSVVGVDQQRRCSGRDAKSSNAAASSSWAWTKECAMVPLEDAVAHRPAPWRCRRSPRGSLRGRPGVRPQLRVRGASRNRPAACPARPASSRRLGGDQGLEMQEIDEPRFDELRLGQRRGHAQDRLVGEEYRAFRHRMHVAGESQRAKISSSPGRIGRCAPASRSPPRRNAGLGEVQHLLEPGGDQEPRGAGSLRTKTRRPPSVSPCSR